jgi:hypothetical protein
MVMRFFEDFSLTEKQTQYNVSYRGEKLLAVNKKGLLFAVEMLLGNKNKEIKDLDINYAENTYVKAGKLMKIYAEAKQHFYHNKKIKVEYSSNSNEFKYLERAIELIERHGIGYAAFVEAQVQGLAYVAKGKGVFPKPNQLCTEQAEDRLLNYLRDNDPKKMQSEILTKDDYNIPLNENEKFVNYSKRIMEGTATLREAKFVQKLLGIRKRKTNKKVEAYIESLTGALDG